MIRNRLLTAALLLLCFAGVVRADEAFRRHRFDALEACPVGKESIVFYGNSITNMNEWWECFGSDPRILNRGNSGAFTSELLEHADSIISGHPAKIFIGIGTNDIGTEGLNSPAKVAGNIEKLVKRFRTESPETEVYVQSILPSEVGLRSNKVIKATNKLLWKICRRNSVGYVDLFDKMKGINSREISYDGLHITADGYRIWCETIAPLVGIVPTFPENYELNPAGQTGSPGMRTGYWSVYPVGKDDVLMIGDEMIHGGEWHELMNSANVKNRGMGWGYGGQTLEQWKKNIGVILGANSENKEIPRAICLYIGVNGTNGKTSLDSVAAQYREVISEIRKYAPAEKTRIVIMSLLPKGNYAQNLTRVIPFNDMLRAMISEEEAIEFADITKPMMRYGVADEQYIRNNYLYAPGYQQVARILSRLLR